MQTGMLAGDGVYEPKPFEIAGVDLFGRRQPDGTVLVGPSPSGTGGTRLPDFPEKIRVCGAVYTLEFVRKNNQDGPAADPGHPGHDIEWGVYV